MEDYKVKTDKELERGLFFIRHKRLFKRIIFSIAIFIIIIIYFKLFFNIVEYFKNPNYYVLAQQINYNQDWLRYHNQRKPIKLKISDPQFLPIGNKKYNLVAFIENLNKDWAVKEFEYRFIINGEVLDSQKAFLNPGESKFLIKLAYELDKSIKNIEIETGNLYWRRYSNDTKVVEWSLTDIKFVPISNNVPAQVFWKAQNKSLFDLRQVIFQIALFNGSKLIAINEIQGSDFMSLDKKNLDSIFWYSLPRITETQIFPSFNWIDESSYKYLNTDVSSGSRVEL